MAILDFPDVSPDIGTSLSLISNSTSFQSELNNATQTGKFLGDQWSVVMPFTNREKLQGRTIKAFLARLGGKAGRFRMTPPDLDQFGTASVGGVIDGAGQTGSVINTKDWDGLQPNLFEAGDYIEFNGELKMVTDTVAAQDVVSYPDLTNLMPSPFDPSGWTGAGDPDGSITNVILANSSGQSYMGLAERTGAGGFNLTGFPTVSTVIGDNLSGAILIRKSNSLGSAFRFRIADSSGFLGDITVASEDGSYVAGGLAYQVTSTGSDILLEFKYTTVRDSGTGVYCQAFIWKDDNTGEAVIGAELYVQAAFFGQSASFPAVIKGTAAIPIAPPLRKATNDLDPVEVTNPQAIFMLTDDNQASWDIQSNYVFGATINCIEDVT